MGGKTMKKLTVLILLFAFSGASQAALIDRGGGFIYDDVLDITWLQDAGISGADTWSNQVAWADSLSVYDSVRDVTWSDWRLASMDVNGDGDITSCQHGDSELECRDNEYSYIAEHYGIYSGTPGPFLNIQLYYWSETPFPPDWAWGAYFLSSDYGNDPDLASKLRYGWAVRDGDVAAIPLPAAVWLFSTGLGLLGLRRKLAN